MANFLRRRDWSKRTGKRTARHTPALRSERLEPRYALSATPIGDAFLVNDFLRGEQSIEESTIAVAATPVNRVVVYEGRGNEPDAVDFDGIYGRIFGVDGAPLGDSFQVNSTTRGVQHSPSVAADDDGSFVVVWAGRGDFDKEGIFLQRYGTDGEAIGTEILVNSTLGGEQTSPSVAMGDNGIFIVSWEGAGVGDNSGIFFRRFNNDGALATTETRVNTTTTGEQSGASISVLNGNQFVVGWQSRSQDGSDWGVYSQRYNSTALSLGSETLLNSTTEASQTAVAITANPLGGYVAAWQSQDQDGDGWGVVARAFADDGTAAGSEVLLNEATVGQQVDPAIAVAEDGQWITAWTSGVTDGSGFEVVTRTFEEDGTANTAEIAHSSDSGSGSEHQLAPSVTIDDETAWVIWSGSGVTDREGVHGQAYTVSLEDDGTQVAPRLDPISDQNTEVGIEMSVTVTATDANARDILTFTLDPDDAAAGATINQIDNNTAIVTWTPDADDDNQTFTFRVLVTDDDRTNSLADVEEFEVTVADIPLLLDLNGTDTAGVSSTRDFIVGDQTASGGTAVRSLFSDVEIVGAPNLSGATLTIENRLDGVEEVLSAVTTGTPITAVYDSATGVLTLSGVATSEEYQQVLRTVVYNNTADDPTGQRTVRVIITEDGGPSTNALAGVQIVNPNLVAFAQALTAANARLEGSSSNEATTRQIELFEDGQNELDYTEDASATAPSWVFDDGTTLEGYQTLAVLSAASGVAIPQAAADAAPFLAEVSDQTLLVGSPLHVPLDGYDANGGPLTYEISVQNVTGDPGITAEVLSGNRSARVDVEGYGDMVFELFEQRAPLATGRMIELAGEDFYEDILFHRVIDDFVIQGGDPLGTGTGGSTKGDFDDQFDEDLQHNRTGLLSMAKSSDDTNDSQFFITEGDNTNTLRNLDYNHTVFGLLVEGEANRAAISDTPVTSQRPNTPVEMNGIEIFEDTENGVLMLKATDGATGSADVTVTVRDQDGNTSQRTFRVTLQDDVFENRPYLVNTPALTTVSQGEVAQVQLESVDVDGGDVFYFNSALPAGFSGGVNASTGLLAVTPPASFTGTISVEVFVGRFSTPTDPPAGQQPDEDFQTIQIEFT